MKEQLSDYESIFTVKDVEINELKIMVKEYEMRLNHAEE